MCRFFQEEPFFLLVRDNSYFVLVKIPEPGRDGSRSGAERVLTDTKQDLSIA
jgi:hypothetical protein